jgi:Fic family protein
MHKFLQHLDADIQQTLLCQLRDVWTHTSTALEGNTLSLGDTKFVIEEGLTVSGKPIKDHQEVLGHARAIELIYAMLSRPVTEADLFALHNAVQTETITDIYKPNGAWKLEQNGTYAVDAAGKQIFIEYAQPSHVPRLMAEIVDYVNSTCRQTFTLHKAPEIYAKIHMGIAHVHPFWDGNGRMARLVANIPLLVSGLPPIVIATESRREYIQTLSHYQQQLAQLTPATGVWPQQNALDPFIHFCEKSYAITQALVVGANTLQQSRNQSANV